MAEGIIISLIFLAALGYLGYRVYEAFRPKSLSGGCAKNCGCEH
jgi:hypothetical protein